MNPMTRETFTHFGVCLDNLQYQIGNRYKSVDWRICETKDIKETASHMLSVKKSSQQCLIYYDGDYPHAIVMLVERGTIHA